MNPIFTILNNSIIAMTSSKLFVILALCVVLSLTASSVIVPSERLSLVGLKCGLRPCSGNTVCVGENSLKKCVVPMKLGGPCGTDPYLICSDELACSDGRCVKFMRPLDNCTDPFLKCQAGLVCNEVCVVPVKEVGLGERRTEEDLPSSQSLEFPSNRNASVRTGR